MRHSSYNQLLINNKDWVDEHLKQNPSFFDELSKEQKPRFLFIGCSDSRVPITSITKVDAGEEFIHRNIANQVGSMDINLLAILEYAVEILEVEHIIVLGHYACGGIKAAYNGIEHELVENWVNPIKEIYYRHKSELDQIENIEKRLDKLAEYNVIEQVQNVLKTPILTRAFRKKKYPLIHGWIFDIYSGYIKELSLPVDKWTARGLIPEDYS